MPTTAPPHPLRNVISSIIILYLEKNPRINPDEFIKNKSAITDCINRTNYFQEYKDKLITELYTILLKNDGVFVSNTIPYSPKYKELIINNHIYYYNLLVLNIIE